MSELEYDVVVLGGGTAGSAAARTAHAAGAKTVMFNAGELGGLCILRGCMPTKTMLHAAHLVHEAGHHHTPGIGRAKLDVDFGAVMANKQAKVERFKRAKVAGIEKAGYEVVDARARFLGPDLVEAGGKRYRFKKGAVIATGSMQSVPPIPGVDAVKYWTSDDVMALQKLPRSIAIIGSGAIGVEFTYFFARLGVPTTIISRRPIYADADPMIAEEMAAALDAEPNVTLLSPWSPLRVSQKEVGTFVLDLSGANQSRTIEVDALLLATGRRAAVDDLNLEAAGVEMDGRRIRAGTDMRTSNPKVFVAGDATNDRLLLHTANWEGAVAGKGAAQVPGEHHVEQRLHVEVVFSDPALATVGMNEAQARAAGHDVVTASARLSETGRAITMDVQHGAMKLVAERSTGEILGFQMLGVRADEIVHTISTAMYYRGTAAQLVEMPWYHPTVSEVILSLARDIDAATRTTNSG